MNSIDSDTSCFLSDFRDDGEVRCNSRLCMTHFLWEVPWWNLIEINFRDGINCEFGSRVFFPDEIEITVWLWSYAGRKAEQFRRIEVHADGQSFTLEEKISKKTVFWILSTDNIFIYRDVKIIRIILISVINFL